MTQIPFPQPIRLGPRVPRWRLSDLEAFEAACRGQPAPEPRDGTRERYLTAEQVAERFAASINSVWRWAAEARRAG